MFYRTGACTKCQFFVNYKCIMFYRKGACTKCQFFVNYKSVMFYRTCPSVWSKKAKRMKDRTKKVFSIQSQSVA
jgi:hypothetical protein